MNSNSKKSGWLLYGMLTLIVAAILVITLLPFIGSRRNDKNKKPEESTSVPEQTEETETAASPESEADKPSASTDVQTTPDDSESTAPAESSHSPASSSGLIRIARPAEGYLLKGFDAEMPVYSLTMNDYRVHLGIDVGASIGDAVCAFADGSILHVYDDPMNGRAVTIDHGNGLMSHYFNLANDLPEDVYEGALVHCGQIIGAVGDTTLVELSDEPHLHFELTENGAYVDPMRYLSYETQASAEVISRSYEG